MSFANAFSHFVGCFLVLWTFSFAFELDEVPVVQFFSCFPCFYRHVLHKSLWPRSKKLLPVFFSRIVMDCYFTFRSFIHFEFIFVCGVREWSSWVLLHVAVQFVEETVLFPADILFCFVKDYLTIELRVHFWVLYSVPWTMCLFQYQYDNILMMTALSITCRKSLRQNTAWSPEIVI